MSTMETNRIVVRHSVLKALIIQRTNAIECIGHARLLQDRSWESKEMHNCRRLNYWIRNVLHTAFTNDHDRTYNRITELGKLI